MPDEQLGRMFETTASTYDLQNRLLSLARDRHWRNVLVARLGLSSGSRVADLAMGTGEVSLAICARWPGARVVGVDISRPMLRIAERKIRRAGLESRIRVVHGDLRSLPLPDASVDAITLSFGIRNIAERSRVLAECRRVLVPGGRLSIMEMTLPDRGAVARVYRLFFDHIMPTLGNLLSGTDYAYTYLAHSVRAFPRADGFAAEVRDAGFVGVRSQAITWGTATIWSGRRPGGGS